jgi:hypothetical protein
LFRKPVVDWETHLLAADGFSIQFANGGATGKNAHAWCYRSFGDILASTTADWSFLPVPRADGASSRADGASSRADGASGRAAGASGRADTEDEVAGEDEASGRPGGMADYGEASGPVVADVATRGDAAPLVDFPANPALKAVLGSLLLGVVPTSDPTPSPSPAFPLETVCVRHLLWVTGSFDRQLSQVIVITHCAGIVVFRHYTLLQELF